VVARNAGGPATGSLVVPDIVWVGFLRVTAHPRAFTPAATPPSVAEFARAVPGAPAYRHLYGLADGTAPFCGQVVIAQARGTLVTDTSIATIALSFGAAVATFDRDYRRFDGLRLVTLSV